MEIEDDEGKGKGKGKGRRGGNGDDPPTKRRKVNTSLFSEEMLRGSGKKSKRAAKGGGAGSKVPQWKEKTKKALLGKKKGNQKFKSSSRYKRGKKWK